jgi:hypothetical protein
MPTVSINNLKAQSVDWDPLTSAGYPSATLWMGAVTSTKTYRYFFPYAPVQFEFSNLGNEFVQIERPGNHPLLVYKAPKLVQVSFSFLAIDRLNIYEKAGEASIEKDLAFLAKMAALDAPIRFSGSTFLTVVARHFGDVSSTPRSWKMTEFSINVRRKTSDGDASQAECSVTLIEDRNPNISVVSLPPIVYTVIPPTKIKTPSKPSSGSQPPGDAGGWTGT